MAGVPLGFTQVIGKNFDSVDAHIVNVDQLIADDSIVVTSGDIQLSNGTAAAPSLNFISDPDTGIFRSGANALGIAAAGVEELTVSTAATTVGSAQLLIPNGTAAIPAIAFSTDTNTGFHNAGLPAQALLSLGGADTATFTAGTTTINQGDLAVAAGDVVISTATNGLDMAIGTASSNAATTAATLNATAGIITVLFNSTNLATGASTNLVVTNSTVAATSLILLSSGIRESAAPNEPASLAVHTIGAGTFTVTIHNLGASSVTADSPLQFLVIN